MSTTPPDKPAPAAVSWRTIARVADEANADRLEPRTDEELARELRAAGLPDDAAERALDRALGAVGTVGRARAPRPRRWVPLLAAAALFVLALLVWQRAVMIDWFQGQPAHPAPTGREQAALLRKDALAACDAKRWKDCADELDRARVLDPDGEKDPRVVAARAAIRAANGD